MEGSSLITFTAKALCEAIVRHSEIYGREDFNPEEVATTEQRIAELTSSYCDIARETTGVEVSFRQDTSHELDLLNERLYDEDSINEASMANWEPVSVGGEVFVVAKWHIRVNEPAALVEFARQRIGRDATTAEGAVRLLCEEEGWKPEEYQKGLITLLSHDVQICS
jgi:hypothetical protein